MNPRTWAGVVLVLSFCAIVHFACGAWRAYQSPEFKADVERLREQRRRRKAGKR